MKPTNPAYNKAVDQVVVTLTDTTRKFVVKANSANYKCALILNADTSPTLITYDFDKMETGSATVVDTVASSLYSGITIGASSNTFDISDDCKAIRINNIIIHKHTDGVSYVDTLPTGVSSLANPAFSADFSLLVTDSAVYTYTPKTGSANGLYTLSRNDSFYLTK